MTDRTDFEKAAKDAEAAVDAYNKLDSDNMSFDMCGQAAAPLLAAYRRFLAMPAPDLEGLETKARLVLEANKGDFANPQWWSSVDAEEMVPLVVDIINVSGEARTRRSRSRPEAMEAYIESVTEQAERAYRAIGEILHQRKRLREEIAESAGEAS